MVPCILFVFYVCKLLLCMEKKVSDTFILCFFCRWSFLEILVFCTKAVSCAFSVCGSFIGASFSRCVSRLLGIFFSVWESFSVHIFLCVGVV